MVGGDARNDDRVEKPCGLRDLCWMWNSGVPRWRQWTKSFAIFFSASGLLRWPQAGSLKACCTSMRIRAVLAGSAFMPTEAGFRVLAGARQILHLAQGLSTAAADTGSLSGHVRIASYRSVATHLLPPALEALAQAYPGIRIDIDDSFEEREGVAQAVPEGGRGHRRRPAAGGR